MYICDKIHFSIAADNLMLLCFMYFSVYLYFFLMIIIHIMFESKATTSRENHCLSIYKAFAFSNARTISEKKFSGKGYFVFPDWFY